MLAVCLLCHTAATTQAAATWQEHQSIPLCQAEAASVAAARPRDTVAGPVKGLIGSSTSLCARCCKVRLHSTPDTCW
jgi:hypothetical protein